MSSNYCFLIIYHVYTDGLILFWLFFVSFLLFVHENFAENEWMLLFMGIVNPIQLAAPVIQAGSVEVPQQVGSNISNIVI